MKALGNAIVAAGILALSTGAFAADREHVAFKINTTSVDFADAGSVAAFRRDIEQQIAAVCNPGDRLNADMAPDFKCRNEMAASIEPKIQHLVARATDKRFAGVE